MSYLECEAISKRFPGVLALDRVSLSIDEGSVRALVGENGAGKSTLLKVLSGVYASDGGALRLGGTAQRFRTTTDALRAGIAVIYQELNLAPEMSVAENLFLGHLPTRGGLLQWGALRRRARELLAALGEEQIDPAAKVGSLPIAQRQMVEIAKALARDAKVIAFDEPTSSLSEREVRRLFQVIADLKAQGRVVIYVSHRLQEIFEVCDSVTVFRDGRVVETFPTLEGLTQDTLVSRMVGRQIADVYGYTPRPIGGPVLEARGITGPGLTGPADLTVRRGEIVGLFGLVGAGRTELLRLLYGATRSTRGRVTVEGRPVRVTSPDAALAGGIVYCSEDRKKEGIVAIRSVRENINLGARRAFSPMGLLRPRAELENARRQVRRFDVRAASLDQEVGLLSGGNQQKVILGRALSGEVKVVLLDEPTRGIDVGAKSEMYAFIYELASAGAAVVVVSSDLPEVLGLSDRVVVMRQGAIAGALDRAEADEESALRLALPAVRAVAPENAGAGGTDVR